MVHVIGDAAFAGDTLLMPDGGSARGRCTQDGIWQADAQGAGQRDLNRFIPKPILANCRTGTGSATLWSLADILSITKAAGYDMKGVVWCIGNGGKTPVDQGDASFDIVIVGAG